MSTDMMKLDASESVFFQRQLETILAKSYDEPLADLPYQKLFPITSEGDPTSTEITYRMFKGFGFAKLVADYATDFPRVDILGYEASVKIKTYGASYGYNIMEIRRANKTGFDLENRKAKAARRAIEEKLNTIAFTGDSAGGITGFLSLSGITTYTVPTTGTGSTSTWSTKTPVNILIDLFGVVNAVVNATYGKERPKRILLAFNQYTMIQVTQLNTYNDTTILGFFKQNMPEVEIIPVREIPSNTIIAYDPDPDKIRYELPMPYEQFPAYQVGMEWVIPAWARVAGLICTFPLSVVKGIGI